MTIDDITIGQAELVQELLEKEIAQIKESICNPLVLQKSRANNDNDDMIQSLRDRLEKIDELENIHSMFIEIVDTIDGQDEAQKETIQ